MVNSDWSIWIWARADNTTLHRRETYILLRIKCLSRAPKGYFLVWEKPAKSFVKNEWTWQCRAKQSKIRGHSGVSLNSTSEAAIIYCKPVFSEGRNPVIFSVSWFLFFKFLFSDLFVAMALIPNDHIHILNPSYEAGTGHWSLQNKFGWQIGVSKTVKWMYSRSQSTTVNSAGNTARTNHSDFQISEFTILYNTCY